MRDIEIDLDDYDVITLCDNTVIREGENGASQFLITLNDEFLGYKYRMMFQLNRNDPYNTLELTPDADNIISYTITNVLTYLKGTLKAELQAYTEGGILVKTAVFYFKVTPSISGTPVVIPDEYDAYLDLRDHTVMSVNGVEPVSGDVTIDTDEVEPTITRKYVPETPASPALKFLNGNNVFSELPMAFGDEYVTNNTNSQSIPSGTAWTRVIPPALVGNCYNMNVSSLNMIITITGYYQVNLHTSSTVGTNGVTIETTLFKNETQIPNIHGDRYIQNANNESTVSIGGIVYLTVGDQISLRVKHNNASAVNLTVRYGNLSAHLLRAV